MKNLLLAGMATTLFLGGTAQKSDLVGAAVAHKDLNPMVVVSTLGSGDQAKIGGIKTKVLTAKKGMDACMEKFNAGGGNIVKPKDKAKMYMYLGKTYLYYGMLGAVDAQIMEDIKANEAKVEENTIPAFKKSLEASDYYEEDINQFIQPLAGMSLQGGVAMFQEKKYAEAYEAFVAAGEMRSALGVLDTLAYYNAGLAADFAEKYDDAVKNYQICADAGYGGDAKIFQLLIQVLNKQNGGKPSEATLAAIQAGKKLYPTDKFMIVEEFNYHYLNGDSEKAQQSLKEAIAVSPNDPILHFTIGVTFDDMATKAFQEKKGEDAEAYINKAIESYDNAIKLDEKYFDALYNMGALYNNYSFELQSLSQNISDMALMEKEEARAKEMLFKGIPYLEKAHEIMPNEPNTLKMLKSMYFTSENDEKYAEVKAKLEALGQ